MPTSGPAAQTPPSRSSSLFDLRSVIALLFGVYGLVLLIMGIISGDAPANLAKTGGMNLNLDVGIAMLITAALFALWVRLRPLRIITPPPPDQR
ncbi:MAG: hypothetical protein JO100_08150 [Pseudonocardia sp.]|nr:hypothetical protein [Pseudonocardia sp.]